MKKTGDRFLNEKGELCQVIAVAIDDATLKERVVYQKLAGDFEIRIEGEAAKKVAAPTTVLPETKPSPAKEEVEITEIFEGSVNPDLLRFLEADSVDEKLEALYNIKDTNDEKLLSAIEASLDITYSDGTPEERISFIRRTLMTKAKYEGSRLRN